MIRSVWPWNDLGRGFGLSLGLLAVYLIGVLLAKSDSESVRKGSAVFALLAAPGLGYYWSKEKSAVRDLSSIGILLPVTASVVLFLATSVQFVDGRKSDVRQYIIWSASRLHRESDRPNPFSPGFLSASEVLRAAKLGENRLPAYALRCLSVTSPSRPDGGVVQPEVQSLQECLIAYQGLDGHRDRASEMNEPRMKAVGAQPRLEALGPRMEDAFKVPSGFGRHE